MQHLATTHMLSSALSMHLPDRQNDSLIIAIPRGYNQVYTHSSVQATSLPHSTHIRLATACRGDSTLSWLHRSILWYWIWIPQCWHQDRYVSDCCHDYVILWIYRVALALLSFGGWTSVLSTTARRKGHHTKFTKDWRLQLVELQLSDYRHSGPAIRRPEKRHVSSLLREKRQETEYTSTRALLGYSRW